jgi:hypothetical protein
MHLLTKDRTPDFLTRFISFNDGAILKVEHGYPQSGGASTNVWMYAKDRDSGGCTIVLLHMHDVVEMVFRESGSFLRNMGIGLTIDWFETMCWIAFQPYSVEMNTIENYRKSYFYVVCHSCHWEVVENYDQDVLLKSP